MLILALISVGLSGVGLWRLLPHLSVFRLETVRIEGLKRLSEAEVRALLPAAPGENLFVLDLEALRRTLEAHPWVARAQVSRDLPHTLVVRIREERPVALTKIKEKLYYLNEKGEAFAEAPNEALFHYPVVSYASSELLQKEASFFRLLSWLDRTDRYLPCYESLSQIYLAPDRILVYTREGLKIRFEPGDFSSLKEAYRRLDRVMSYLYDERLLHRARLVRLDYPEGRALVAYREGK
ncbi:FtsQ-type POTRA domain-containing protein [Thermosulfurimonas marina]|uniref:FtsQ-type POTRA domain-containing protein n=1 Tax=Thermosulfurimonas marina TaxID=2047767 RepID=A0A6H1WRA9_9BACT|nr:FtsQ-type POTRA domain-containing protein [Thermosulfurimonas marina]QJA05755.1 FtsQ-type POTRA domain-containing protein [Thermosulfurimonas marina]